MKEKLKNIISNKKILIGIIAGVAVILAVIIGLVVAKNKNTATPDVAVTPTPTVTLAPTNTPTNTPSPTPTSTPTPTPDPYEGMVRSPLNNEYYDAKYENKRPVALMFNNIYEGLPQCGLAHAGVVYECEVEGGLTRLMGIVQDYDQVEAFGSIRSVRTYYIACAMEYDAILSHYGGPHLYVDSWLSKSGVDNIDGTVTSGYYRTSDRYAPHNAFTSGDLLVGKISDFGFNEEYTDNYQGNHFSFAPDEEPNMLENGQTANTITTGFYNGGKFTYDEESGLYLRYEYDAEQIDEATGEQLKYKNVIFQFANYNTLDHHGYLSCDLNNNSGTGYYATNGKYIPITWSKEGDFSVTKYFDEEGNEILLNTGNTWITIIRNSSKYDGMMQ